MTVVYKSKSNLLLKILFTISVLVILIFSVSEKKWGLFAVAAGLTAFVFYLFFSTIYTVSEETLHIKSGFLFDETVEIDSIKKITGTRKNLLTGPGFSVERLIIDFNDHDRVIISPESEEAFIAHLKSLNPDIETLIS